MCTFCGYSLLIYRHLVCDIFIKSIIVMSRFAKVHRPYGCDPLSLYISLVNNSIHPIISYWSTFINYIHQYIYILIKDRFNLIDRSSCQPIGCQATPRILGDMECMKTPV